jgi:ATP-dependent exoDNAse (exonuclease V) alpha subunit
MKAMVLMNIATESDLANGSRGVLTDIILDPREDIGDNCATTIRLVYPPVAILFKPLFGRDKVFPGLPRGTIPIFPTRMSFTLQETKRVMVKREQFALTPAYAFTDYKSQGQTMECVIIHLAKPLSGTLTGFNAYVALSRSRGRKTIRLLRDFDEKLFTTHPSEELRKEDVRLAALLGRATESRCALGEFNYGPAQRR